MIPVRTSISLGLRVIPPSAGLARLARLAAKTPVGHRWKAPEKSFLRVVKDVDLEQEIEHWKEKEL